MVLTIASFEYAFLPSYKFHVTGLTQFCPSNSEKKKKKKENWKQASNKRRPLPSAALLLTQIKFQMAF